MGPSEIRWFSDDFTGNRIELIRLDSLRIRSGIWQQFLKRQFP